MTEQHAPGRALIIGASRGLGLGLVHAYLERGWTVTATRRIQSDPDGLAALQDRFEDRLSIALLDIDDRIQIEALRHRLRDEKFDLLFVVAGVNAPQSLLDSTPQAAAAMFLTNAYGPGLAIELLHDLVVPAGTIAAMSSGLGSIARDAEHPPIYRATKAALNMFLSSFERRHRDHDYTVLSIVPGWVKTDMGGPDAPLDLATSVNGIVAAIAARSATPGLLSISWQNDVVPW